MKAVFFILVAVTMSCNLHGRIASYSIFSEKDELLGELKVSSVESDSITRIKVMSALKVTMIFSITVKYTLTTIYKYNELYSSSAVTFRNDKLHSVANTTKVGSQYLFKKDDEEHNYTKKIPFSESLLYFNEPKNIVTIYSEFDGVEKAVTSNGNGHYSLKNPINGNISEYFYEGGLLEKAIVSIQLMTVYIKKKQDD